MGTEVVDHFTKFKRFNLLSPWYKHAGVYADFVGSSRFFVSVSANFCFAGSDLKLGPRSNFTFVFLLHLFWLLGAVFMSLSFQFFLLNRWFEYYLSFVLRFHENICSF